MGSMHTGLEEVVKNGKLDDMAEYFAVRARGGVGLCVTGGIAPNNAGRVQYFAAKLSNDSEAEKHRVVAEAVHDAGGKIAMQILHTGRYAYHHWAVSSSTKKSPISMFDPSALTTSQIESTIEDFVRCAELAAKAGYDGVEIMGSEGYLINQFLATEVNDRTDEWGGPFENRSRLAIEIVRRTREALGQDFIIIFRLSMLDLVEGGSNWEEVELLARGIEEAGASIINTGIGWHQARIPTIATSVPRAGFAFVTKKLMKKLTIPLCTTNRINMPSTAEQVLADGYSDMISMARPFLADPEFIIKAKEGREDEINTCIGCNQACLDHVFQSKRASCLVNPRAGYEKELELVPATEAERANTRIAVVGAGPAGLACAVACAERGFATTLFEATEKVGGQFNLAKRVPGKEEFFETMRYFDKQLQLKNVNVKLNTKVSHEDLEASDFTHVVFATGVVPRNVSFPGANHEKVVGYTDVLSGKVKVGQKVAIIGAGGIGFDVAEFLSDPQGKLTESAPAPGMATSEEVERFCDEWGIDSNLEARGGLLDPEAALESDPAMTKREIYLLQRKSSKVGAGLGKTTGWIKRTQLKFRGVHMMRDVKYKSVDRHGLHIEKLGEDIVLDVDHVVVCAGQTSENQLWDTKPESSSRKYFLIGGAEQASEVDAKRAFDQGTRLAANILSASTGDVFNQPVPFSSIVVNKLLNLVK